MIAMWASSQEFEGEARRKDEDKAQGVHRVGLSPAAILRRAKAKKEAQRVAKQASNGRRR
jgi:hypothetical protein